MLRRSAAGSDGATKRCRGGVASAEMQMCVFFGTTSRVNILRTQTCYWISKDIDLPGLGNNEVTQDFIKLKTRANQVLLRGETKLTHRCSTQRK
jgi:hypothetical protein